MPENQPRTETPFKEIDILTDVKPILDIASAFCSVPGYETKLTNEQFEELLISQWEKLEEKVSEQNISLIKVSAGEPLALSPNLFLLDRSIRQNDTSALVVQEFGQSWQIPGGHNIFIRYSTNETGTLLKSFSSEEHLPAKDNLSSSVREVKVRLDEGDLEIQTYLRNVKYYGNRYPQPKLVNPKYQ